MDQEEMNIEKMETQLLLWADRIDELVARLQRSDSWARIDLRQRIDDLKVKRALVRAKIDEFTSAPGDKHDGLWGSLVHAWDDLKAAFDDLKRIEN